MNLQEAVDALEMAHNSDYAISDIEPMHNTTGGWVITFSNGKSIEIVNGAKEYSCQ